MRKHLLIVTSCFLLAVVAWFLAMVFAGNVVLPQSFPLGPLLVRYYGIIMAVAIGTGYVLARIRSGKFSLSPGQADDLLFWLIVGGFLGARLYHILSELEYYRAHPLESLMVWNGGLSIYGAVFGGLLALYLYHRIRNPQRVIGQLLDWLTPSLLVGQIIGRFGNLFNYEAFGYPTSLPWKMFVPAGFRPEAYLSASYFHPLFLYEALGNAAILAMLLRAGRGSRRPGALFIMYLLLYNSLRIFLEFLRIDSVYAGPLRQNAVASLVLVTVSLAVLAYRSKHAQVP